MDMTLDQRAARLLQEAERLMNDEGRHWIKGMYKRSLGDGEMGYCASGALLHIYQRDHDEFVYRRAWEAFTDVIGDTHIPSWNDAPQRTWPEVKAAFQRAIKNLKK